MEIGKRRLVSAQLRNELKTTQQGKCGIPSDLMEADHVPMAKLWAGTAVLADEEINPNAY